MIKLELYMNYKNNKLYLFLLFMLTISRKSSEKWFDILRKKKQNIFLYEIYTYTNVYIVEKYFRMEKLLSMESNFMTINTL